MNLAEAMSAEGKWRRLYVYLRPNGKTYTALLPMIAGSISTAHRWEGNGETLHDAIADLDKNIQQQTEA